MEFISYLQQSPGAFIIVCTVIGLLVGSFLNVVILRLPVMMEREWRKECQSFLTTDETIESPSEERFDLVYPPSRCPQCQHKIRAWENIPLLSYLLLRGRCSGCGKSIPWRYPAIETVCGLLSLVVAWHFGFGWPASAALVLSWSLLALSVIDFDKQLLPDSITLPLLWLGLALSLFEVFINSHDAIIGAIVGYLCLWIVFQGFKLLTGKEGMGYGDFKLLAVLGAWIGWQHLLTIILLSSLVGAIVGLSMIIFRGHDRHIPIPFGPYIATAGWVTLLWGNAILNTYLNWIGVN